MRNTHQNKFFRSGKGLSLAVLSALFLLLAAPNVFAITFIVNSTADVSDASPGDGNCATAGGECTLRAAIEEANALAGDDAINVPAGTYNLTNGILFVNNWATLGNITITGAGTASTIIDGSANSGWIFYTSGSITANISGMTIKNGTLDYGGCVYVQSATNFVDVIIENCAASASGGAIYQEQGSVNFQNSILRNNTAAGNGGAVYLNYGPFNVLNSTISGNTALNGGGFFIAQDGASLTVTDSTISGNTAAELGGGIYNSGTVAIVGSTINGNQVLLGSGWGGGLFNNAGTASLTNVTVSGNQALGGAGVWAQPGTITSFESSTIADNLNLSGSSGAGIMGNGAPAISMHNTIFSNNLNNTESTNCYQAGPSLGYNLSSDGTCLAFSSTGDVQNTNPLLGPLQDNGGPTFTQALLAGSPAIDAGDPSNCQATDQRGTVRPQNSRCDIGAFEFVGTALGPDLTGKFGKFICRYGVCKGSLTVSNIGDTDAGAFNVTLFYSFNGNPPLTRLSNKRVAELKTGVSAAIHFTYSAWLTGQNVIAVIDKENRVEESDETNNRVTQKIP